MTETIFRRRLRRLSDVVTVLIALAIAYLTLTQVESVKTSGDWDKAAHALAFFALVFPTVVTHRWGFVWMVPLAAAFGGMIELIQPYVGRGREFADFQADLAGILTGAAIAWVIRRFYLG